MMVCMTTTNDMSIALLMQEVLCALVYERREYWNAQHPNKSLGLRKLDRGVVIRMAGERDVLSMPEAELRAYAAEVVKAALIEPPPPMLLPASDVFYFGCWGEAGHYLHDPTGHCPRESHAIEHFMFNGEKRHLDGNLAPRLLGSKLSCGKLEGPYPRSAECPQGQFLRHELSTGFTAIAWWDRNQGDTRGACNSTVLVRGSHTTETMLANFAHHFPSVKARLDKAGVRLVEMTLP